MKDKEIGRRLRDTKLYIADAIKAWPRYPEQAHRYIQAALEILEEIEGYVDRPMGGKGGE